MDNKIILGFVIIVILGGLGIASFLNQNGQPGAESQENNENAVKQDLLDGEEAKTQEEAVGQDLLDEGEVKVQEEPVEQDLEEGGKSISEGPRAEVREFELVATNYQFSLNEIRVKEGDIVRITLINEGGFHDWVLDEFNAATNKLQQGQKDTIEFVATSIGQFEYYCSVGNHRALGMKGTLIVE